MPPLSLNRKLKPAKRAWKSFTNMLRSKLENLKVPTSIKSTSSRVVEFFSRRLFVPFKKRFLTKTPFRSHNRTYKQIHQYQIQHKVKPQKNFAAVCIDRLYGERQTEKGFREQEGTSRSMEIIAKEKNIFQKKDNVEDNDGDEEGVDTIEDAWRAVVASSPHLRVDERAEEFIYKFREERRIEKERSLLEFEEMLKTRA